MSDDTETDDAMNDPEHYHRRPSVAGQTSKSLAALSNLKRIIGDLSNTDKVLLGLDVRQRDTD